MTCYVVFIVVKGCMYLINTLKITTAYPVRSGLLPRVKRQENSDMKFMTEG